MLFLSSLTPLPRFLKKKTPLARKQKLKEARQTTTKENGKRRNCFLTTKRFPRSEQGSKKSLFLRWEERNGFYIVGHRLRSPAAARRPRKLLALAHHATQDLTVDAPRAWRAPTRHRALLETRLL
jgi:hypothetical protein